MSDDEPSVNIPSLLTLAVVSFLVIRWFLNRETGPTAEGGSRRLRGHAVDPAQVEQVAQMFPQLSVREIMWDLQRNGGSVAATTERILGGRGLEVVSFFFFFFSFLSFKIYMSVLTFLIYIATVIVPTSDQYSLGTKHTGADRTDPRRFL